MVSEGSAFVLAFREEARRSSLLGQVALCPGQGRPRGGRGPVLSTLVQKHPRARPESARSIVGMLFY